MELQVSGTRARASGGLKDYLEVVKPRETSLLVFLGLVTALLAGGGSLSPNVFVWVLAALLLASAGANGLTNYLDRELDSQLARTRHRALPSGRIFPSERALYFAAALSLLGLILAWTLHPYVFLADLIGTLTAITYRKRVTCVFPQGMVASCAPILMGWLAITRSVGWELLVLCLLIGLWLPSHIWSIMLAHRQDYLKAGIDYFPLNRSSKAVAQVLFISSLLLYGATICLYFAGAFGILFLVVLNLTGISLVFASLKMMRENASSAAWRLYKLSAFPYLGVLFLAMALDILVRTGL